MQNIDPEILKFIKALKGLYPNQVNFNRAEVTDAKDLPNSSKKGYRAFMKDNRFKVRHGVYFIPDGIFNEEVEEVQNSPADVANMQTKIDDRTPFVVDKNHPLIPEKNPNFVAFGEYTLVEDIMKANQHLPLYISGESGNGKTEFISQASAVQKRPLFRVNITSTTDEDDLLGGFRLQNGDTVWQDGPIVEALKTPNSVLLLDELDLGTDKILCLQPVLEGKGVFIKKIGQWVKPSQGFTIVATGNTKGKSDATGRYVGTKTLNEAFLDRFLVTIEQEYPSKKIEKKILGKYLASTGQENVNEDNEDFIERLTEWAEAIRKTYKEDGIDEQITTRRLIQILMFFIHVLPNREKAIRYCISRFDEVTIESMLNFYSKIDEKIEHPAAKRKRLEEEAQREKDEINNPKPKQETKVQDDTNELSPEKIDKIKKFIEEYNSTNFNKTATVTASVVNDDDDDDVDEDEDDG